MGDGCRHLMGSGAYLRGAGRQGEPDRERSAGGVGAQRPRWPLRRCLSLRVVSDRVGAGTCWDNEELSPRLAPNPRAFAQTGTWALSRDIQRAG